MSEQLPITIRDLRSRDISFLFKSLLNSHYKGSPEYNKMRWAIYEANHTQVITSLLQRPTTRVRVAVMPDDEDVIFGYVIWEPAANKGPAILHYLYTKGVFRKKGLARALMESTGMPLEGNSVLEITHWTPLGQALVRAHPDVAYFNPYNLYKDK